MASDIYPHPAFVPPPTTLTSCLSHRGRLEYCIVLAHRAAGKSSRKPIQSSLPKMRMILKKKKNNTISLRAPSCFKRARGEERQGRGERGGLDRAEMSKEIACMTGRKRGKGGREGKRERLAGVGEVNEKRLTNRPTNCIREELIKTPLTGPAGVSAGW